MGAKVEKVTIVDETLDQMLLAANKNTSEFFTSDHVHLQKARGVHRVYQDLLKGLNESKHLQSILFLFGAHSAYLSSARLCTGGQLLGTYMTLRGVLENALYGFFCEGQA